MRLRRHLPLTLCCAALLLAAAAAPPSAAQRAPEGAPWRPYQPPSKLFTAEFPGVPVYESRPLDYGPYKETAHRHWVAQPGRDGGRFEVTHIKSHPNDGTVAPSLILDTTIDTILGQYRVRGLRETGRREVIVKSCVGREFDAVDSDGLSLRGRMFVAGDQVINAIYVGPAESAVRQQEARRFLDSVAPAETCAPPPPEPPAAAVKKLGKLSGALDAASGWRLLAPAQSGFSVLMPTAAEGEEELAQEKPFPLITRAYTAEDGDAIYVSVECGDFPPEMSRIPNFEELKANLGHRALLAEFEAMGVKVIPDGNVRVSGYEGRQYRLTADGGAGRALVISSARKFYFFAAFAVGPSTPTAEFDRFFSSLKLTGP